MLLSAKSHIGVRNINPEMQRYVWKRNKEGLHLINIGKTWEKLMLAARVIVAIENPADVVAVSARPYGQRAVFKFAQNTGGSYIGGRYTPGTFTNQVQKKFMEPRLLIVNDPLLDHQPVKEASYVNIPVIAFADTDAPVNNVDLVIPCNNRSKQSIALLYWLLAREVLRLRGTINRKAQWEVIPDLFLHRELEDTKDKKEESDAADDSQPDAFENQSDLTTADPSSAIAAPATSAPISTWGAVENAQPTSWANAQEDM
jgi:small subunit ribosomal protein SAe